VLAFVLPHVDQLGCFLDAPKRAFDRCLRAAGERHNRAVRTRARIDIQQRNTVNGLDGGRDLPDDFKIAAFGKIGNALDDFLHVSDVL
jgi:hypothetical protein